MDANPTAPIYHRCTSCHRLYKDPKYLPCSHSYCEECLVKFEDGSDMTCILCEMISSLTASITVPAYGEVGKEVKFTIVTKDDKHYPRYNRNSRVNAQAKPRTGDTITAEVEDSQNGRYMASFVPIQPGEVEVLAYFDGKIVGKQPLIIQVYQHTTLKPNKILNDDGKMGYPWGIAFGKDGVWAVVDHSNHCVCIFDNQDQLTMKFGSEGSRNGQFSFPCGLTFDANNNLYVADDNNHRVQKFDINGDYLLQFGNKGSGNGELFRPRGITVSNDRVFVADCSNYRISVFQCDGQFSNSFGSRQLKSPYDVAITNNNQIFVVDYAHLCIFIFSLDGKYVDKIAPRGKDRCLLCNPSSLSIDSYGFILVTEFRNHRVSVFDKDGILIRCFGSPGSNAGQFLSPCGIACSPNGSVYICDSGNKRIQIFSDY